VKTADEIIIAMKEVCDAASESGFTFCASLAAGKKSTHILCGSPLLVIGLSGMVNRQAAEIIDEYNKK
jgi:hypothetical protein